MGRMGVATLIVVNGRVLTMDDAHPRAEAVALQGERVLALGDTATIRAMAGAGCRVIDAQGATVLPGLIESHLHLFLGGNELAHLPLLGVHGADGLAKALGAYAAAHHRHDQPGGPGVGGERVFQCRRLAGAA